MLQYTLDQLHALDTIARVGTFAAAGKELGRTTSAISYAIRSLEDALGLPLFDRSGHRAELTEAGERMLTEARHLLGHARRLHQVAEEFQEGYEPLLGICLDGILPMPPIMEALKRFSRLGLPTHVQLMVEYLSGVNSRFGSSGADMMLVLDFEGHPELSARPLPPIKLHLVVHRDHPLTDFSSVSRSDLNSHIELVVSDSSDEHPNTPDRLYLGASNVFRLSDFHSKCLALLGGVGYGWLPAHLAAEHLASGELVELNFEEGARHTLQPFLVHRRDSPVGRAGRLFIRFLEESLGVELLPAD